MTAPHLGHDTAPGKRALGDDMVDSSKWLSSETLGEALRFCQEQLSADYQNLDWWARFWQKARLYAAMLVTLLGLVAVVAALVLLPTSELGYIPPRHEWVEVLAVSFAFLTVIFGVWLSMHQGWLLDRHRAERLRRRKFHYLISPALWAGLPDQKRQLDKEFEGDLRDIRCLMWPGLEKWVTNDDPPRAPVIPADAKWSRTLAEDRALSDLLQYYCETRLSRQLEYFIARSASRGCLSLITYKAPQYLFFLTAVVVFLRLGLKHWWVTMPDTRLLTLAVALPALGAAIRSFRLAKEVDRNALRFQAKKSAMETVRDRLRVAQTPEALFHDLWACEYVLESDHREWLRLMIEAEWFG